MNNHLANCILGDGTTMDNIPELWGNPLMSCLRVSGIFDNPEHRTIATTCLVRISNQIPSSIRIHSDWWLLGDLNRSEYFKMASRTGLAASLLWYAGSAGGAQLKCLEKWVSHTSLERNSGRALVAMIADNRKDDMGSLEFIVQLQSLANDKRLGFFCQRIPSSAVKSTPNIVSKRSNLIKTSFNYSGRHQTNEVRQFGINE